MKRNEHIFSATSANPHGLRQGAGYWPFVRVNSARQKMDAYAKILSPLREAHGFSVECYQAVVATITRLLKSTRPAAVTRLVIAIVVFSFQSEAFGTLSHIVNESLKAVSPLLANGDSPRTVVAEVLRFRIGASLDHAKPNSKQRVPTESVSGDFRSLYGLLHAATTYAGAIRDSLWIGREFTPTKLASKPEQPLSLSVPGKSEALGSVDCLPGEVFESAMRWNRNNDKIGISHDVTSNDKVALWIEPRSDHNSVRGSLHCSDFCDFAGAA